MGVVTFLRRILDLMNTLPRPALRSRLTIEFHRDLEWWHKFLDVFNSHCDFLHQHLVTSLQTVACTIGLGVSVEGNWCYFNTLVDGFSDFYINCKEAICVVLSTARWCHAW